VSVPDAGKSLGRGIREFKGSLSGDDKHDDDDDDEREARELAAIQPVAVEPEPVAVEKRQAEPVA
jgi:Sec-independent protein translocase protein TatA